MMPRFPYWKELRVRLFYVSRGSPNPAAARPCPWRKGVKIINMRRSPCKAFDELRLEDRGVLRT